VGKDREMSCNGGVQLDFFFPRSEFLLLLFCFIFWGGERWGKFRYIMEILLEFRNLL